MADNMVYSDTRARRRPIEVGSKVAPGTPGVTVAGVPFVTVTGSGDNAVTKTLVDGTVVTTSERGGVSLRDEYATVAFDGSWAFDVEGADVDVVEESPVYITAAGVLTLDADDGDAVDYEPYGVVDFFRGEKSATDTVVRVGVGA